MKGHRFELFEKDGRWCWELRVANQPTPHPIARCGAGYETESAARESMESARKAIMGAFEDGKLRVERVPPPR